MSLKQPFDITIGGQRRGSQNYSWAIDPDGNATFATVNQTGTASGTQTFTNITVTGTTTLQGDASVAATKKLYLDGGGDTYLVEPSANVLDLIANGTAWVRVNGVAAAAQFRDCEPLADSTFRSGTTSLRWSNVCSTIFTAGSATTIMTTSTALTDYAAAQAGTLLNAPAAGNPTKWIAINDNGTVRKIPAW